MGIGHRILNLIVTAVYLVVAFSLPLAAENSDRAMEMLEELPEAEPKEARRLAREIEHEWSKTGSAAMDLLLKRGREALEAGDSRQAIEHLTALTDHAPEFAEGWHLRAIAFANVALYGPALDDLGRALTLNPHNFNAMYSLGSVLEQVGHDDLALEAFERSAAIHPQSEDVTKALDRVAREIGGADL
ncbi:tetratricopeptide repeat protein [Roseovarius sp. MMSF_3281]|uniref:tetratricopeptide repeat protein n=1 Tax=Roseovarius sp. MMSF_3281 TaxID=3046694 RepID=UPI00273EB07C|nr:tetratricopeptide repeat protein [Roseovarius sp. MMSF_3281]